MRYLKILAIIGVFLGAASFAQAQRFAVGIGVGPAYVTEAPVCEYSYYGYSPYECAPYGYYGPSWFSGGFFIGAGPWFPRGFYGRPGFPRGPEFWGRGFRPRFEDRGHDFDGRGHGFVGRGPVGGFHGRGNFHGGGHGGGRR